MNARILGFAGLLWLPTGSAGALPSCCLNKASPQVVASIGATLCTSQPVEPDGLKTKDAVVVDVTTDGVARCRPTASP
jgi:hypothetical protein